MLKKHVTSLDIKFGFIFLFMVLNLLVNFFVSCFIIRSKTSSVGCGLYDTRTSNVRCLRTYMFNGSMHKKQYYSTQIFNGDDLRQLQSNIAN